MTNQKEKHEEIKKLKTHISENQTHGAEQFAMSRADKSQTPRL